MKTKVVTFDSRAELKAWFDLRGDEDRTIIYSHRETLPNNMIKYEAVVTTRQGTYRVPEKATNVVKQFLEKGYSGTLGISSRLAEGVQQLNGETQRGTGTVIRTKMSYADQILDYMKKLGKPSTPLAIKGAINYQGPGLGSIYTALTTSGKLVRLARGYYIHPDHHKPEDKKPEFLTLESVPMPTANNNAIKETTSVVTNRLVIDSSDYETKVVEALAKIAARRGSLELFELTIKVRNILIPNATVQAPSPPITISPPIQPPAVKLTQTPKVILTPRQQMFRDYLMGKEDRDVTPQELTENVLRTDWSPGKQHRFIRDADMSPHGWYRTSENNKSVWRHESRRRYKVLR